VTVCNYTFVIAILSCLAAFYHPARSPDFDLAIGHEYNAFAYGVGFAAPVPEKFAACGSRKPAFADYGRFVYLLMAACANRDQVFI
jgi:hypothetical protein